MVIDKYMGLDPEFECDMDCAKMSRMLNKINEYSRGRYTVVGSHLGDNNICDIYRDDRIEEGEYTRFKHSRLLSGLSRYEAWLFVAGMYSVMMYEINRHKNKPKQAKRILQPDDSYLAICPVCGNATKIDLYTETGDHYCDNCGQKLAFKGEEQ